MFRQNPNNAQLPDLVAAIMASATEAVPVTALDPKPLYADVIGELRALQIRVEALEVEVRQMRTAPHRAPVATLGAPEPTRAEYEARLRAPPISADEFYRTAGLPSQDTCVLSTRAGSVALVSASAYWALPEVPHSALA